MNPALLIRVRPSTPWRIGPETGSGSEAAPILHSDAVYSAVTLALGQLGLMEEWLEASAQPFRAPAVRFTSAYPWQRSYLYVPPPEGIWPPESPSSRVRWKGARLVPASVVAALVRAETLNEEQWEVDGPSGCLTPANSRSATGPFRYVRRSCAAVDRPTGGQAAPYQVTCLQFAPASGLWCAALFANPVSYAVWAPRLQAAFRLLADSGLGGLRSRGFGRARGVDFQAGPLPELLFGPAGVPAGRSAYWLLSLFSPADDDAISWDAGDYRLIRRGGRVGPPSGRGQRKLTSRMVAEGSVLVCGKPPAGRVWNVAPQGCLHPVYRAGYAVAIPIPWPVNA